jgi:hypothetical protein
MSDLTTTTTNMPTPGKARRRKKGEAAMVPIQAIAAQGQGQLTSVATVALQVVDGTAYAIAQITAAIPEAIDAKAAQLIEGNAQLQQQDNAARSRQIQEAGKNAIAQSRAEAAGFLRTFGL